MTKSLFQMTAFVMSLIGADNYHVDFNQMSNRDTGYMKDVRKL